MHDARYDPPKKTDAHGVRMVGLRSLERILAFADASAASPASVLIRGETGTGKDVIARTLHARSRRRHAPFVVIDCGALSGTLAESELFGHARGAFTGAFQRRVGLFEQADGGTVFLDEIGELPLELQPKLLRVLEQRTVRPLGTAEQRSIDVRILAATHRDLAREVREGRFREDLLYRLAVHELQVPALRERQEDLRPLVEHLLSELCPSWAVQDIPPRTWRALCAHDWPGNIRELRNVVEGWAALEGPTSATFEAPRSRPASDDSALRDGKLLSYGEARLAAAAAFEREYTAKLLRAAGNSTVGAARIAGVSPQLIRRLIKRSR